MTAASSQPDNRAWAAVQLTLYVATAALLVVSLGLVTDRWQWALRCPYDIEYGEGGVLLSAINIAHGNQVYNDFSHLPYTVETYPPVFALIAALGVKLFGVSFAFGRLLSMLGALGTAALIWAILRRAGTSRLAAALAAIVFLVTPITGWWARVARVDMVALFFGIAGLYCVVRGGRWLIPAVGLMALAVYTRQTTVAPLAASLVYLWWIRERKNAVLVLTSWAAVALIAYTAFQAVTHGLFYKHIVVSNQNLWQLKLLAGLWTKVFVDWPYPYVMGVVGAAVVVVNRQERAAMRAAHGGDRRPVMMLVTYFLFAALSSLAAGKIGAYINYMIEIVAGCCLMAGLAYDRLAACRDSRYGRPVWAAVWLGLAVALVFPIRGALTGADFGGEPQFRRRIMQGGKEAVALIRQSKGDVLSEDGGLPLLAGRQLLLEPFEFTQMFRDGNWDQRPLLADIKRRRFALIILRWDPRLRATDEYGNYGFLRWSVGMGGAIMRNYYLLEQTGFYFIMAPADARHPAVAAAPIRR